MEIPEINSKVLSVRLEFCDKFSSLRYERFLIFLTPVSVSPPPHISRDLRFLKSGKGGGEKKNKLIQISSLWTSKALTVQRMLFFKLEKASHDHMVYKLIIMHIQ